MPARTPRSARMRLDFSESDQGPLSKSPFAKSSPTKTPKSSNASTNNAQSTDLNYVTSRLFRSPRRNLYFATGSSPQPANGSAGVSQPRISHTSTNINDALQIGQNREQITYQSIVANELLGAGIQHIPESAVENNFGSNYATFPETKISR